MGGAEARRIVEDGLHDFFVLFGCQGAGTVNEIAPWSQHRGRVLEDRQLGARQLLGGGGGDAPTGVRVSAERTETAARDVRQRPVEQDALGRKLPHSLQGFEPAGRQVAQRA